MTPEPEPLRSPPRPLPHPTSQTPRLGCSWAQAILIALPQPCVQHPFRVRHKARSSLLLLPFSSSDSAWVLSVSCPIPGVPSPQSLLSPCRPPQSLT